ncbi:hypothetical protein [Pedobacter sp. GR22-10]|uniref:hypothetical protein n=1 Tax=Pedobacter sp. GR22-10 TaxID=2994472 RepID=UPI002245A4EF|nr:hypothetical protein [Pedobacter sp. GR22-10]MCX2430659.1 hypothetical protein [Pedobacter sp. GR22-10]
MPKRNKTLYVGKKKKKEPIQLEITNNTGIESNELPSVKETDVQEQNLNSTDGNPVLDHIFDSKRQIYLEIHKGNIYHYFSSGIIIASIHLKNRAFTDVQSLVPNKLILSNFPSGSDIDDNILLELDLSDEIKQFLTISGEVAFLDHPVPITWIKTIIVKEKKQQDEIISDALLFSGGFIPAKLFVVNFPEERRSYKIESDNNLDGQSKYEKEINKFDKILGLFAYLRNYSLLVADNTNNFKSLPDHFFYAMQAINPSFGSKIVQPGSISEFYSFLFSGEIPDDKQLLKWIFNRLHLPENFNDQDVVSFGTLASEQKGESITIEQLRNIFLSLNRNLERKKVLKIIESSKTKSGLAIYLFAFLRNYGNLNSIEISRKDISEVYSASYGEYAFALLGYFFGYSMLRNTDERLSFDNPLIAMSKVASTKPAIRFKLETAFDSAVINLVFGYVFHKDEGFIGDIKGLQLKDELKKIGEHNLQVRFLYSEVIGMLYEKIETVAAKLEMQPVDIEKILKDIPSNIPYHSEIGQLCRRLKLLPMPLQNFGPEIFQTGINEMLSRSVYSKSELINQMKISRQMVSAEELTLRITLSKLLKEH